MKNKILLTLSAALLSLSLSAQKIKLVKKWETDTVLKQPESVIYDAVNKIIYTSNIDGEPWGKDGSGFISKITPEGKVEKLKWITGLDAPKGLGIFNNKLYIADITKVVIVDIKKGKIEKTVDVTGAKQLNDVTVDESGKVYISDSGDDKVYQLEGNKASLWVKDKELKGPNGVLALKNNLKLIDMGSGNFYEIDYTTKKLKQLAKGITAGDGLVEIGNDEYLISNWNGEVNYVKGDKVEKILDTKAEKRNAADIWYIPSEKLLLIPTFFGNTVAAYQLKK